MTLSWMYLIFAGFLEICWAIGLKYTHGFTRLWPSLFTLITLAGSILFLSKAAHELPIGTAYAVWVGIGVLGAVVLGIMLFGESVSFIRLGFLCLLLISILGLKFTTT